MTISQEAEDNKPKKPLNAYFKFRGQKLKELKDHPEKMKEIKRLWGGLDENIKKDMEDEYHQELQTFKKDYQAWIEKYDIDEEDLKKKSKKKGKDTDDDEDKKPVKTKGTKETKEEKPKAGDKKKEGSKPKSAEKEKERGKSKTGADKKKK